jgi:hypothetical protein
MKKPVNQYVTRTFGIVNKSNIYNGCDYHSPPLLSKKKRAKNAEHQLPSIAAIDFIAISAVVILIFALVFIVVRKFPLEAVCIAAFILTIFVLVIKFIKSIKSNGE